MGSYRERNRLSQNYRATKKLRKDLVQPLYFQMSKKRSHIKPIYMYPKWAKLELIHWA